MTTQTIRVRKKGQITLPASVRRELGVEDGDALCITKSDGRYLLTTVDHIDDPTAGALAHYAEGKQPVSLNAMNEAVSTGILESWQRFVRETESEYDQ